MNKHSEKYEDIKKYYTFKLWDLTKVSNAVEKGWITKEEYEAITGQNTKSPEHAIYKVSGLPSSSERGT